MERAISPTPTPSSFEAGKPRAANPQRSLVAERRTSYRLFPIVEPTPPASPVTLQKASLSKAAGNHRRRSSSLEHHHHLTKDPSSATGHATPSTTAIRLRDSHAAGRKASLPEIRPLRAVKESDSDVSAKLRALPPRPHTAVDRALEGSVDGRSNSVTGEDGNIPARQNEENHVAARHGRGLNFPSISAFGQGRRVRSRPNLRIAVSADDHSDENPPPPPPKSPPRIPRHARDTSNESQLHSSSPRRRHATATGHVRDDSDPPSTPSVAQKQSLVSLSPTLKVREFTVSPVARGRVVRKETPTKMHELLPSDFLQEKPLPPVGPTLQPPSSKFSDLSVRPSTSDGQRDASNVWRGSSVPPPQRPPPPAPAESQPTDPTNGRWSRIMTSSSRSLNRQYHDARPQSPEVRPLASNPVRANWDELPMFASRPAQRSVTPEPKISQSDDAEGSRAMGSKRRHVNNASRTESTNSVEKATTDYMPPQSLSKASLALAAARANVAALRNSNASTGSPGSERRSRSSGSDIGTLSRHPSDGVLKPPPSPGAADPIETLKDLNEQVEALHARYASLKAERQKISTSITNTLKEKTFGPETANMILDEQLSLAAVSSSMDICFAKLKSLDCRKEDAIAALIARTTQSQKNPNDNISTMIASMALARKTSLAPSMESGSRFNPTGRTTPDLGDNTSMNRLTQPSTRTLSYGSEPESLDYRMSSLSRKQSNGGDSVMYGDSGERQTPETIPEDSESPRSQRVSRIHDSASVVDLRTSDVSALSPVLESHPRASLAEIEATYEQHRAEVAEGSSDTAGGTERNLSPTSERSMSPDDLLDDPPKKIRVNGSKAAKILGLLGQSADGKDSSPLIRLPAGEEKKKIPVKVTEVEIELHQPPKRSESLDDTSASLLSVHTKDTEDGSISTADTQASSEPQDLENQLKSFPKPNPNTLSTHSSDIPPGRRDTGGSFLTNGSSADEPDELPEPTTTTSRQRPPVKSTNGMRKRDRSEHTIQVYLEHDEILDYYNNSARH